MAAKIKQQNKPTEWKVTQMTDIVTSIVSGKSDTKNESGIFPLYGSTGIIGYKEKSDYSGNKILIARVGANAGTVNLVSGDYCVSDNTLIVSYQSEVNIYFQYYYLIKNDLHKLVFGSGQPLITAGHLKKLTLLLPSLPEQDRIVAVLETWDQAVDKLKRRIEVKKEIKKGLMQELLFGKKRLSGFNDRWQDVELGEFVTIRSGDTPSGFNFVENGQYPFYKVEDMNHSHKYLDSSRFNFNSYARPLMKKDTVVFPKRGASIFTNKVRILTRDSYCDTNVMGLTVKNGLDSEFLYYLLLQIGLARFADTTSVSQINNKHIEPLVISLPSMNEQRKITNILGISDKQIEKLQQKLSILKDQKKYLLNNLVTGTIRTPETLSIPK